MKSVVKSVPLAAVACVLLAGCASAVYNTASNAPWTPGTPLDMGAPADVMRENSRRA